MKCIIKVKGRGFQLSPPWIPKGVQRKNGPVLAIDEKGFLKGGRRWMPVMGEFHFSRYPSEAWKKEIAKIKSGAVDIISSYIFWIHHFH